MTRLAFGPGLFRLLLALLVVGSHLTRYEIGRPAVFVFFMLSGYWVTRMYAEKYRPSAPLAVFYLSRIMRIWLPFAAIFLIVLGLDLIVAQGGTSARSPQYLWGLTLLGIASNHLDVLGTSWSLDIELQFYLLVPFLIGLVRRTLLAVALMVPLTVAGWVLQSTYGLWTVLSYLPCFMAGALIWAIGRRWTARSALVAVAVFLGVGAAVWLSPWLRPLLLRDVDGPFNEDWFGIGWTLLLVPFVGWNVGQRSGARDRHFGNLSFMLYLVHWPVIALARVGLGSFEAVDRVVVLGLIAVSTLAAYLLIDRPLRS